MTIEFCAVDKINMQ